MTTITLKNIPESLHQQLRESAARHHRSLNREILFQLAARVQGQSADVMADLEDLHRQLPEVDHRLVDELKRQGRP